MTDLKIYWIPLISFKNGAKVELALMISCQHQQGVMAFNACVMRFQVIGEHVGKLLRNEDKPLDAYPDIPWNAIYGMRNNISHEYGNIDEEIIVSVINDDLPSLKEVIEKLLEVY